MASVAGELSYELTGLSASTTITAGVAKICYDDGGQPDTSAMRTVEFRTGCGSVSLPYHEDFSGLGFVNALIDACDGGDVMVGGFAYHCGNSSCSVPVSAL